MGQITPQPTTTCDRLGFSNFFGNQFGAWAYNDVLYVGLVNSGCRSNSWNGVAGGTPATKCYAQIMKSVDNGVTWTGPLDSLNSRELPPYNMGVTSTDGFQTVQAVQDGQTLYVARPYWDYVDYLTAADHKIVISRFDFGTETWMTDSTAYGDANAPTFGPLDGLTTTAQTWQFLRRASDGAYVVVYTQNNTIPGSWRFVNRFGDGYDHTYLSVYSGGAWAAPVVVAGGTTLADAFDAYPNAAQWGDNDRLHIWMASKTGTAGTDNAPYTGTIYHRSMSGGGVLDSLQTAVVVLPAANMNAIDNYWVANCAALTVGGVTELLTPFLYQPGAGFNTRELHVLRCTSGADPAISEETVTTDYDQISGSGVGSYVAFADPVAEQFQIITTDRIQENAVQYVNSAPGVWDLPVVLFAAANFLMGCVGGLVYQYSGDYYFGLPYTDGPSGAYWADDVFFYALGLGAAPPDPPDPTVTVGGLPLAGGTGSVGVVPGICGVNAQPGGPWWQGARVAAQERLRGQAAAMVRAKGCNNMGGGGGVGAGRGGRFTR